MKKITFVSILTTVLLVFLVASVGFFVPMQAKTTSVQAENKLSAEAIEAAMKSLSVNKIDSNTLVIEGKSIKTVVEKLSDDHYKTTITNSSGGDKHIVEMINTKEAQKVLIDGEELGDSWKVGNATVPMMLPPKSGSNWTNNAMISEVESVATPLKTSMLTTFNDVQFQPLADDDNVVHFQWDGVEYVSGGSGSGSIKYAHPDKDYLDYHINIFDDWSMNGNLLVHSMINYATSVAAGTLGPAGIAGLIGAAVGSCFAPPAGTIVGAIITGVYGAMIWYITGYQVMDEDSNIWYWQSIPFLNWFSDNLWIIVTFYPGTVSTVASMFGQVGYLKIGEYGFVDQLGIGYNPSPSPDPTPTPTPTATPPPASNYYVSSITHTETYGSGAVNNANGLIGSTNDGSYVQLWGGNYNDGGQIVGWMSQTAHGHIYLYGHSGDGYYSHVYTFVSYYNNNDWTQTSCQTIYGTNNRWIDCGTYGSNFRYIAIVGIDDNGNSCNFFIDSVKVEP